MNKKIIIVLFLITCLAFFLRIYNLTRVPPSPDWDEAALGYNAYSLLKTGRDEFGNFMPITLRSFNDYKPAFYVYTAIPSVAIFGLSLFSVRLPSVVMGTLTVLGLFFLAEVLRKLLNSKTTVNFSLISAMLLAISPWHLQFSRAAFEVNSALFLIVFGTVFLLYGLKNPKLLIFSSILLGLSLYAYHSSRVFVPLILLVFFFLFKDKLLEFKKYFYASLVIGVLVSLPVLIILVSPAGRQRLAGVSIYTDQTGLLRDNVIKIDQDKRLGNQFADLWHNRRFTYISRFVEGYLWDFTPQWLFLSGDSVGRHHAPDMGLLYLVELPFVLYGLLRIGKDSGKGKWIIIFWLLLAPIAGAPTNQTPHAVRSYFLLIPMIFFSASGLYFFLQLLKNKSFKYISYILVAFLFLVNFIYYLNMYFVLLPREYASYWQYGYQQAISETEKISSSYDKIIFSGKLEQPYIFYLFYTKYDPQKYLALGGSNSIDFNNWSYFVLGKYEFKFFDYVSDNRNPRTTLYIGRPQDFPGSVRVIKSINYPDGKPAIYLVEG